MKKLLVLFTLLFTVGIVSLRAQSATAQATGSEKSQCTKAQCAHNGQCAGHSKTASKGATYECKECGYTASKPGKCACGKELTKVAVKQDAKTNTSGKM